jgi:hypothetical protein
MLINAANDTVQSDYDLSHAKEPAQETELTWQTIVAEEPLTGSHWEQWESISTDDDDSDDSDMQGEVEKPSIQDTNKA